MEKLFAFTIALIGMFVSINASAHGKCIQIDKPNGFIHVVSVDLTCPEIKLVGTQQADRGETVSQFAEKYRVNVAINGGYFREGFFPFGLTMTDGQVWDKARDTFNRSFLACDAQNHCTIDPINHVAKVNPKWNLVVPGWQVLDASRGDFICADNESTICSEGKFSTRHPRTSLGLSQDGKTLYIVVVEGRLKQFQGLTLKELAAVYKDLNVTNAINLDGGGSTTLVVNQKRVSRLPDEQPVERVVADHFGVICSNSQSKC